MITAAKSLGGNGKEYTNIVSINPVPVAIKKAGLPEGFNKPGIFVISEPDMELFGTFSDYLKEKIQGSPEWRSSNQALASKPGSTGSGFDDMDDDIPF